MINPFDQPDVEAAKVLARKMIAEYKEKGAMPEETPALKAPGISVYGDVTAGTPGAALDEFLEQAGAGRLCGDPGLSAPLFRNRGGAGAPSAASPGSFPHRRDRRLRAAFSPLDGAAPQRGCGRGLFIQLTADDPRDVGIPDELGHPASALSFGVLKAAQASATGRPSSMRVAACSAFTCTATCPAASTALRRPLKIEGYKDRGIQGDGSLTPLRLQPSKEDKR